MLVTGGAGYIGSHAAKALRRAGYSTVIYDNFSAGHPEAALGAPLIEGDISDVDAVRRAIRETGAHAVMHFAAYCYVGESVQDPLKYYLNNVAATLHLLQAMVTQGVRKFVFSSTCATFGVPATLPISEDLPQAPINPYGQTKLDIERALLALSAAQGLSFAAFRYFNAAGAAEDGTIGEDHHPETHLIPVAIDAREYQADHPEPGAEADEVCDYLHGDELDVASWAADAIVLSMPHKILCREDCRGLCPSCGANLNDGPCQCPPPEPDDRWGPLRSLLEIGRAHV